MFSTSFFKLLIHALLLSSRWVVDGIYTRPSTTLWLMYLLTADNF